MTALLKQAVTHARITSEAHIRTPENAETIIASGEADLVSIVRGQIADPHLARKTRGGPGRRHPLLHLVQPDVLGPPVARLLDFLPDQPLGGARVRMGRRQVHARRPRRSNILVVGAGPAGLEAARVAAERGHRVEIVEASGQIGGQFRLAGMQPRRAQILDLLDWYERQFDQTRRDAAAQHASSTQDEVAAHPADTVILATGSLPDPIGPPALAAGRGSACRGSRTATSGRPKRCIRREARLGDTVILYDEGGNWRGGGTAWWLAEQGKTVILVTPDAMVGKELTRTAADGALRRAPGRKGRADADRTLHRALARQRGHACATC